MREETAIYTAFDDHVAVDIAEPEKNLMRSILRSAIEDFGKTGEVYRDARLFFLSRNREYLFSFLNICNHLNVSPESILRKIGLVPGKEDRLAA